MGRGGVYVTPARALAGLHVYYTVRSPFEMITSGIVVRCARGPEYHVVCRTARAVGRVSGAGTCARAMIDVAGWSGCRVPASPGRPGDVANEWLPVRSDHHSAANNIRTVHRKYTEITVVRWWRWSSWSRGRCAQARENRGDGVRRFARTNDSGIPRENDFPS